MNRKQILAALFVVIVVVLATSSLIFERRARVEAAGTQAPRFEVDPMWPKPLPNHWVMGSVIGVSVDASDHIWVIHREGALEEKEKYATWKPPAAECCAPAPPVLEFNEAGDLVGSWGGPGTWAWRRPCLAGSGSGRNGLSPSSLPQRRNQAASRSDST